MRVIHCVTATAVALLTAAAPAQAANSSLTSLTESQTFPAIQSTIKYTKVSTTKASGQGNYARATSSVIYDKATNSYILRDTGNTALKSTFDLDNADASSTAEFTVVKHGANESLRIYNPGATIQGIALTYTGYGQWRRTGTPAYGTGTAVNDTYFVYGLKTPSASMPTTGGASYTTALDGTYANKTGVYAITGTGNLAADWGARSLTYSATLAGSREGDSAALAGLGALTGGIGTIGSRGSSFQSRTSATGGGYSLGVMGYFFGPAANEVGGVFRLTGNGGNGQGAMVGKQ
jgi:hypothetical protein